jgi:FkbM family methyltransferase
VVAVEPNSEATILLRHNIEMNVSQPVADRLTVIEAAAWDTPGKLRTEPAMTGGHQVYPLLPGNPDAPEPEPPTVASVRLDKELESVTALQGMPLSVVKVDAPGRGHRALGGLVRLLRRDRPNVFCAFSASQTSAVGDDPSAVLREFGTWGFDVVLLGDDEPATPAQVIERAEDQHSVTLWLRPRTTR